MNIVQRILAVAAVASVAGTGFAVVQATAHQRTIEQSASAAASAQDTLDVASETFTAARAAEKAARAELESMERVLAERPAFLAAVETYTAALATAQGKVDAAVHHEQVLAAQAAVQAERADATVVAAHTATVAALAADITTKVAEFDAAAAAAAARTSGSGGRPYSGGGGGGNTGGGGGGDWLGDMRWRLNAVGGGHIGLWEYDGNCGGGFAAACYMNGGIAVHSDIAGFSDGRKNWAMAHEYAHAVQMNVLGSMRRAPGFNDLFGGNLETLANCMAEAIGYGGGHGCTGDQSAYASGVWSGSYW